MAGATADGSERSAWRAPVAVAVLLGLVGVVAIAATGRAPARGESSPSGHPPTLLIDYLSTIAVLFVPAGAILIVWAGFMRRMDRVTGKNKGRRRPLLGLVLLAIVLGVFIYARTHLNGQSAPRAPSIASPSATTTKHKGKADGKTPPEYQPRFRWLPALILGSLVVAFGGSAGALVLRRRGQGLPPRPVAVVLAEVLSETLDDLRNEPDPRKAVIGAYARMERTLAARGVPREPFEAPLEYLARVLDLVQVSSHSVSRLTGLFERARFSPHEIDFRMKENAIESLVGIRAELEAAT